MCYSAINVVFRYFTCLSAIFAVAIIQSCSRGTLPQNFDVLGDTYEIRLVQKSESSGNGSTGSSNSRMSLIEKVVELRSNGVVLEFDLPPDTSPEYRAIEWQFPARVLKRTDGRLKLVNYNELEARMLAWLERAELDRSACGAWTFTWNAVKIECDPQSVLEQIKPFDLRRSNLIGGAMYEQIGVIKPSRLLSTQIATGGATFEATMEIDPNFIRRQNAESDIIVAKILGDNVPTLTLAMKNLSSVKYSGTVATEFKTDTVGHVVQRTTVTKTKAIFADGAVEQQTVTEIVNRELLLGPAEKPAPVR